MGSDAGHDVLAEPFGWQALIDMMGVKTPAIVDLGHFGGDLPKNDWNLEFTKKDGNTKRSGHIW